MTRKRVYLALTALVVLILAAVILCGGWKQPPFRLHIVANSDSAADQQVKMAVRDAVLFVTAEGIAACKNEAEAEEYMRGNLGIITQTANAVLKENGADYHAVSAVGTYHFPDRTYQNVTYPEGDYRALRIVLGEGEGHNWWCVMFPPLCISEITGEKADAEYASYFAELWEQWFGACP